MCLSELGIFIIFNFTLTESWLLCNKNYYGGLILDDFKKEIERKDSCIMSLNALSSLYKG